MKNNITRILVAVASASLLLSAVTGCDKDDYAKINTDPAKIGEGNVPFLFTQAYLEFEPSSYLYWYYVSKITKPLVQATGGSRTDRYNVMGELGGIGSQFVEVRKYENEIKDIVSRMSDEEAAKYQYIQAAANAMSVYLAILDTDLYGSMPYSEAVQARYGGTLTPKYDTQKDLFETLISEINADIAVFSDSNISGQVMGSQDPIYAGNADKWRKFANGVKLKIAVRLLHQDKAKALTLAQEVAASNDNIMTTADSFIYNKGLSGENDMSNYAFHFENGVEGMGSASKEIIDFMKKNTDPRMLVMYSKNSFNAEVVQAFFDAEQTTGNTSAIPSYVLENIEYTTDGDGKKTFVGWKGAGEPWVRYYGVPVGMNISTDPVYNGDENYFNTGKWVVDNKSYTPYSSLTERLVRGRVGTFTFPTKKDVTAEITEYSKGMPWYGMAMSAGEINLYLAELSLAGANLPKTAAAYFEEGVRASAVDYNRYANLNKIPYITKAYCYDGDPLDAATSYGDAEIAAMLTHDDYKLTGDHRLDLEKVYLQQFLHFMYQPVEQFVSARRGGVPMKNSTLIPWCEDFDATQVPRRLYVPEPTLTDIMRGIKLAAYQEEGFTCTTGESPQTLNTERVWYDQGAPQWGEGPNL